MKTSWRRLRQIEKFLTGEVTQMESDLFRARLDRDEDLKSDLSVQRQAYQVIRDYARKQVQQEIAAIDQRLFNGGQSQEFQRQIHRIFS
ncbi:MAG TPA: hypothetical protein P5275_06185 [Saprospiraceae bacterium]|nr:hypothetical protein [Saprospiraceae bacterium]MCB9272203.1 hypothetical protein [Lewinellaceae bacterium]HPG08623.1 hypothetical protein [Saprospiraceae bacterium]HRV84429.1 hypothetical protein [Saprospiraceae bacterium]